MAQWQVVFFIAAIIYVFCATFYNIFGSGERQPWDNPLNDEPTSSPAQQQNGVHATNQTNIQLQSPQQQQLTTQVNGNGVHESRQ